MNLTRNQNRKIDNKIPSRAKKRYTAKRKISAILSVTVFLQDICVPFEIMTVLGSAGLTYPAL
jgi:hypothetical protein